MAKAKETIIRKGVEAALKLASDHPWGELTLADIAKEAGLDLSEFHGVADKADLAAAVEPMLDKAMSAEPADMEDPPRERLFDVIMLRFEKMEESRAGLLSLQHWREKNPARIAALAKSRMSSARWALASAGLDSQGDLPMGLRAAGLAWILARTERAWRKETSADFSRTMAELDKQLREADERSEWVAKYAPWTRGGFRKQRGKDAEDAV